ncbi:hypothetical protein SNEBB_000182 [Seison nebaliae]|nr:hypothetical protein SNEBB_000182 [Seison nebaliae]
MAVGGGVIVFLVLFTLFLLCGCLINVNLLRNKIQLYRRIKRLRRELRCRHKSFEHLNSSQLENREEAMKNKDIYSALLTLESSQIRSMTSLTISVGVNLSLGNLFSFTHLLLFIMTCIMQAWALGYYCCLVTELLYYASRLVIIWCNIITLYYIYHIAHSNNNDNNNNNNNNNVELKKNSITSSPSIQQFHSIVEMTSDNHLVENKLLKETLPILHQPSCLECILPPNVFRNFNTSQSTDTTSTILNNVPIEEIVYEPSPYDISDYEQNMDDYKCPSIFPNERTLENGEKSTRNIWETIRYGYKWPICIFLVWLGTLIFVGIFLFQRIVIVLGHSKPYVKSCAISWGRPIEHQLRQLLIKLLPSFTDPSTISLESLGNTSHNDPLIHIYNRIMKEIHGMENIVNLIQQEMMRKQIFLFSYVFIGWILPLVIIFGLFIKNIRSGMGTKLAPKEIRKSIRSSFMKETLNQPDVLSAKSRKVLGNLTNNILLTYMNSTESKDNASSDSSSRRPDIYIKQQLKLKQDSFNRFKKEKTIKKPKYPFSTKESETKKFSLNLILALFILFFLVGTTPFFWTLCFTQNPSLITSDYSELPFFYGYNRNFDSTKYQFGKFYLLIKSYLIDTGHIMEVKRNTTTTFNPKEDIDRYLARFTSTKSPDITNNLTNHNYLYSNHYELSNHRNYQLKIFNDRQREEMGNFNEKIKKENEKMLRRYRRSNMQMQINQIEKKRHQMINETFMKMYEHMKHFHHNDDILQKHLYQSLTVELFFFLYCTFNIAIYYVL